MSSNSKGEDTTDSKYFKARLDLLKWVQRELYPHADELEGMRQLYYIIVAEARLRESDKRFLPEDFLAAIVEGRRRQMQEQTYRSRSIPRIDIKSTAERYLEEKARPEVELFLKSQQASGSSSYFQEFMEAILPSDIVNEIQGVQDVETLEKKFRGAIAKRNNHGKQDQGGRGSAAATCISADERAIAPGTHDTFVPSQGNGGGRGPCVW